MIPRLSILLLAFTATAQPLPPAPSSVPPVPKPDLGLAWETQPWAARVGIGTFLLRTNGAIYGFVYNANNTWIYDPPYGPTAYSVAELDPASGIVGPEATITNTMAPPPTNFVVRVTATWCATNPPEPMARFALCQVTNLGGFDIWLPVQGATVSARKDVAP